MTVLYFLISGLDLLGVLEQPDLAEALYQRVLEKEEDKSAFASSFADFRRRLIEWIYALQIPSGFRASLALDGLGKAVDFAHVTMTQTALCSLVILGDDLSRVNREGILASITELQTEHGCFRAFISGEAELDMRFIYCSVLICSLLGDLGRINQDSIVQYIQRSQVGLQLCEQALELVVEL